MNSTFMGLEIGKRGLMSHQKALNVTGHNISNASNEEYSRQRAVITASDPLYIPALNRANVPGNIGQGAEVAIVERIRDNFIDDRIMVEKQGLGFWKARNDFIYQVEMIYNEPSDQSIRSRLDALWQGFQELSKYPEERSTREVVKEKAIALANEVQHVHSKLSELQNQANRQIGHAVTQINEYAQTIANLNERILKAEALGDNPNDLKDKRDALIEKLSQLVNISVSRTDKDELIVYIGSENVVQGEIFRPLAAVEDPDNYGMFNVVWKQTMTNPALQGGELAGLISIRDGVLRQNINDINSFAVNVTDLVNEIHRDGFGKNNQTNNNFFKHIPVSDNDAGNFDLNNDGIHDVTALFKVSGNNKVDASAAIGITGTLTFVKNNEMDQEISINYFATDRLIDVIKRINDAKVGVVGYINHNSQLAFKATIAEDTDKKNFMIRHLEDSGQLLVGLAGILRESGPQGSFDYRRVDDIRKIIASREHITITPMFHPASYMKIDDAILYDIDSIAAAKGKDIGGTGDFNTSNGVGDGSNALSLAALKHRHAMIDANATFNDFYTSLISRIGSQGQEAKDRLSVQDTLLNNLANLRESVSGINLDEEMANMVQFQHGYNASARIIAMMDRMLETIINLGARG